MAPSRQLRLGAFMRPASHPHRRLALSRRLPGRQFQLRAPQTLRADAGARQVRRLLHGRPPGRAEHADRGAQAQPHGDLVRAVHAAVGAGRRDRAYRPRRHRLDHVRRALSRRAAVRLARPHQRRPRRLEHRHHLQSRRGAEFRAQRSHGARRALSPRARVLRRGDGAVGQLGRRRLHPRRRAAASISTPTSCMCSTTRAKYLSVRGPLNIARPIQGWPVIVQAGASDAGRQLAAETAEAVFTAQANLAVRARVLCRRERPRGEGRARRATTSRSCRRCFVVVGDTVEEARAKRAQLDSLVHYANAIASLSIALGHDASKFDPDGPLPEIPESNASKSGRERAIELARRENLTVRQLAQRLGGYSGLAMVGTPKTIADEMEEWLVTEGSRRLQRDVPLPARRARRFRRPRGAGIAAARPVPARIRRQDAARESRPAAAGEPVLLTVSTRGIPVSPRLRGCIARAAYRRCRAPHPWRRWSSRRIRATLGRNE